MSARDRRKDRGTDISASASSPIRWSSPAIPAIDVFVELIGGEEGVAKESVETALRAGKHVVTANKALLAHHGSSLAALAEKHGVALNFEAAVAGGIPDRQDDAREPGRQRHLARLRHPQRHLQLHPDADADRGPELRRRAEGGAGAGYAEADPTFDIGGFDTAHKLALLTRSPSAPARRFESVYIEGIETITPADIEAADDLGYRIKLLGVASRTESGIEQRVHPTMVPKHTAIASVDGVLELRRHRRRLRRRHHADRTWRRRRSHRLVGGERPHRHRPRPYPAAFRGHKAKELKPYKKAEMRGHEGGYYIRLSVYDRTGAFAAIASRMAEQGISLESIVQRRRRAELPGFRRQDAGSPARGDDHPSDHRGRHPQGAGCDRARRPCGGQSLR